MQVRDGSGMTDAVQAKTVRASAPGKLVICGEYAVLDGAPAICMALDRRARVEISTGNADQHTISAPGFSDIVGRCKEQEGELEWLAGGDEFKLVDDVWYTANARSRTGLSIMLDSSEFQYGSSGAKIGIGSSAALTVALTAALSEVSDTDADAESIAFASHRRFQNGLGSGVDVACSLQGGLIEYKLGAREQRQLEWPAGLAHALLWSGVSASTAGKLSHLYRQAARPSRAALADASNSLVSAWASSSVADVLSEVRNYTQALRAFSIDHELGIFDAGHAELVTAAEAAGLVYKPCGAGGGDVGILLGDDAAAVDSFIVSQLPEDCCRLNMQIDMQGVLVSQEMN